MEEQVPGPQQHPAAGDVGRSLSRDDRRREDLHRSLAELSRLATSRLSLEDSLTEVATLAVRALPGADGAGLTLLEPDRKDTVVATERFVFEIEDIQQSLDQGPCLTAARESRTVLSGSLGADPRWPAFGSRVARLGVHSVLSVPLQADDQVLGAMNVYARGKHVFDERAVEVGAVFAASAAVAVQNAQVLAQTRRLAVRLQQALDSRGVVDRAVGILMSRSGVDEDEAMTRLRMLSQRDHRKLGEVAASIVETAVRRAQSRHAKPGE